MVLTIVTVYCGEEEFEPYCHLAISVHYVNLLLTHRHAHMHMHVHVRTHVHSTYTHHYNIFGCVNYENTTSMHLAVRNSGNNSLKYLVNISLVTSSAISILYHITVAILHTATVHYAASNSFIRWALLIR